MQSARVTVVTRQRDEVIPPRRRDVPPLPLWRRARRVVLLAAAICLVPAAISWVQAMNRPRNVSLSIATVEWVRGHGGNPLVSQVEIPDPQALPIRAILNGATVQESTTANMIFGVADVIAYVTRTITLEPGDLIATGTPAGVGAFRDPPLFMKPGDEITIEIEGVGSLTNPVVSG